MIHEILQEGAENAQTGREICSLLNISMRDLNRQIEQERRQGAPICAGSSGDAQGYFLAANGGEMERFCRRLEHRQREIAKTCRACKKTAATMQRQEGGYNGENNGDQ